MALLVCSSSGHEVVQIVNKVTQVYELQNLSCFVRCCLDVTTCFNFFLTFQDAAVMGGTANYERAFFTDKYLITYPEHKKKVEDLKDLLADQVPLLHVGIR